MSREKAIGGFTFPTRKAAETAVRAILNGTPLNGSPAGDDLDLIIALLHCHHEAVEKIGPGVAGIEVRSAAYGTRCFWAIRADGTEVDFSYRTALDGAKSHRQNVLDAMRWAVKDQIDTFRVAWFAEHASPDGVIICPLSGLSVSMGPDAHVDHVVPFVDLAEAFIARFGSVEALAYRQSGEHMGPELCSRFAHSLWVETHRQRAALRVVHASANLARGRGAA